MPRRHHSTVSSDTLPPTVSIPQLKVVFCGSVCEVAPRYSSPFQVAEFMAQDIQSLDREAFYVLHLNGKNQITSKELISLGSLNQSIVHPREVFKGALLNNSAAIIGIHNHPSGDPAPSREDRDITVRLRDCAKLLGITFLDHIIIGCPSTGMKYFSFVENGWRWDVSMGGQPSVSPPAERHVSQKCEWLIELRKQASVTQKQLAELAGFKHQASISAMENGWQQIGEEMEKSLKTILQGIIENKQQQPA